MMKKIACSKIIFLIMQFWLVLVGFNYHNSGHSSCPLPRSHFPTWWAKVLALEWKEAR